MFVASANASSVDLTCNYNGLSTGSTLTNSCYNYGVTFTTNDSLDFYNAFGTALNGEHNVSGGGISATTGGGVGVTVSLGPDTTMQGGLGTGPGQGEISRVDNTDTVYDAGSNCMFGCPTIGWTPPGSNGVPGFLHYGGQFTAPTTTSTQNEAQGGWGAYLLGPTTSTGASISGEMEFTFTKQLKSVGFNIDSVSSGFNDNFTAEIDAYGFLNGVANSFLGYYLITDTGNGGLCQTVVSASGQTNPVSCSDAPFIGFADPNGGITQIRISAETSPTSNNGFFVDNLVLKQGSAGINLLSDAPEPTAFWTLGAGAALLFAFARKRVQSRS